MTPLLQRNTLKIKYFIAIKSKNKNPKICDVLRKCDFGFGVLRENLNVREGPERKIGRQGIVSKTLGQTPPDILVVFFMLSGGRFTNFNLLINVPEHT